MDLNSATNPELENVQTTKRTTATRPKVTSPGATASMFNNAQNIQITGGSFNITTNTTHLNTANALDVLHKRVAPNAILNAGGRADEVRCHPGTREEVIGRIEKWRDAKDGQTAPIFWLSGPAGAGKTAIVQTIAERCRVQGVPQANFFFFRADGSRNNSSPLVATLLHQVIRLYPFLRDSVAGVFFDDPLILDSILEEQLAQLLVTPLHNIQRSSSSYSPLLLLVDGLDECDSEHKNSQRQILRAFDKVFAEYPCPFRLLVASRDESQITTAFNEISSSFLPLYLDSDYSPERDIRVFVNDQFKHVRKAHPLARTLDATWPPVKDVEGIVKKSSGQFIYAATVMRFISDSSASPALSLQRVQGAEPIVTKSPFAYLDAIYTYILSQVDDQELLKDILRARLLMNDDGINYGLQLAELLQIHDPKYAKSLVRSCIADLTSIAQYSNDSTLLFYHASFSDYLLDKSRSRDYFIDIDTFMSNLVPAAFNCVGIFPTAASVAYFGVLRLKKLPPDFLNKLIALDPLKLKLFDFHHLTMLFEQIYGLCTCDDDFMKYKQIIRGWINILEDFAIFHGFHDAEHPPCSRRYFTMAHIERDLAMELINESATATALRPETDFEILEAASWLDNLLHRIHSKFYSHEIGIYYHLVAQWIFWAIQNDIPLDGLENIPGGRRYYMMARIECDNAIEPRGEVAIALRPETDFDTREIFSWLNTLLHRIYREKYGNNVQHYQQLLKGWISWAIQNDILLDGLDDLPGSSRYSMMARIERDVSIEPRGKTAIILRPESDFDTCETSLWLNALLHQIYREKYGNNVQHYQQLLKGWISWAVLNDIPLDGLYDLPGAQWYSRKGRLERWVARHLRFGRGKK